MVCTSLGSLDDVSYPQSVLGGDAECFKGNKIMAKQAALVSVACLDHYSISCATLYVPTRVGPIALA